MFRTACIKPTQYRSPEQYLWYGTVSTIQLTAHGRNKNKQDELSRKTSNQEHICRLAQENSLTQKGELDGLLSHASQIECLMKFLWPKSRKQGFWSYKRHFGSKFCFNRQNKKCPPKKFLDEILRKDEL